jgi:hypothetical protein
MKTKEELAEEYAKKEWPYWTTSEMFLNCKTDFLAGWDACNSAREKELPLNFWNRLASFISNVQVNDLPGLEEQSMIMHTCEKMLAKEETKQ